MDDRGKPLPIKQGSLQVLGMIIRIYIANSVSNETGMACYIQFVFKDSIRV